MGKSNNKNNKILMNEIANSEQKNLIKSARLEVAKSMNYRNLSQLISRTLVSSSLYRNVWLRTLVRRMFEYLQPHKFHQLL